MDLLKHSNNVVEALSVIVFAISVLVIWPIEAKANEAVRLENKESIQESILCRKALKSNLEEWEKSGGYTGYVAEAQRRGLGIEECRNKIVKNMSREDICSFANADESLGAKYFRIEDKNRNLECYINPNLAVQQKKSFGLKFRLLDVITFEGLIFYFNIVHIAVFLLVLLSPLAIFSSGITVAIRGLFITPRLLQWRWALFGTVTVLLFTAVIVMFLPWYLSIIQGNIYSWYQPLLYPSLTASLVALPFVYKFSCESYRFRTVSMIYAVLMESAFVSGSFLVVAVVMSIAGWVTFSYMCVICSILVYPFL